MLSADAAQKIAPCDVRRRTRASNGVSRLLKNPKSSKTNRRGGRERRGNQRAVKVNVEALAFFWKSTDAQIRFTTDASGVVGSRHGRGRPAVCRKTPGALEHLIRGPKQRVKRSHERSTSVSKSGTRGRTRRTARARSALKHVAFQKNVGDHAHDARSSMK
jgi:hypothetical protein